MASAKAARTVSALPAELDLARAAAEGDEQAFAHVFEAHRRAIRLHCFRMLGSLQDAEDLTQETFLRAWRALRTYQGRSSLRAWLYRIATNACLDALDGRSRRVLPVDLVSPDDPSREPGAPLAEVPWLEPYPDLLLDQNETAALDPASVLASRETMRLAFLAAIHHLSPRQRAILILRDLLHWSASEVADLLHTTVPAVNSSLQRSRGILGSRLPRRPGDLSSLGDTDAATDALIERYVRAWESADVDSLVALLREDAILAMPPSPSWYAGREAIKLFFETTVFGANGGRPGVGATRLLRTAANCEPALALYAWNPADVVFSPLAIKVLSVAGGEIASIVGFTEPRLFHFFELPPALG